ncbi:hypothetical protein ACNFCI_06005 [Pseudomonas sp. NY15356]|uniref:hypothetical protein n=1 Tax=unclassified Pseudomonas TaxID=196821 RepID=UPI003A83D3D2
MLKSVKWIEDQILCVQVADGVYSLAQMRKNSLMEFFDVFQTNQDWTGIDLNKKDILFCLFVAEKKLKPIFLSVVSPEQVAPNGRPIKKMMLSAAFDRGVQGGARLIELTDNYESYGAKVVKDVLSVPDDIEEIYGNELCGMYGNPEKMKKRLRNYFETGVNWDESKEFLFSGISAPPPKKHDIF